MRKKDRVSSTSKTDFYEAMEGFWDNPENPDAEFNITCVVPIEQNLFSAIEEQAKKSGVDIETLVNLWLQQKLHEKTVVAQNVVGTVK